MEGKKGCFSHFLTEDQIHSESSAVPTLWLTAMNSETPGGRQVAVNISSRASSSRSSISLSNLVHGDGTKAGEIQHSGGVAVCQNNPLPDTLIPDTFHAYFLLFALNCPVLFFTEYQHVDQVAIVPALSYYKR